MDSEFSLRYSNSNARSDMINIYKVLHYLLYKAFFLVKSTTPVRVLEAPKTVLLESNVIRHGNGSELWNH